ncbi:hypothetical protein PL373_18450 [Tenacibaculum maritimum]|nr:hypothetical protein [Tenacibaculum maritimum]
MKQFYLILIAFFTLLSCSKDDENKGQAQETDFEYTLEVKSRTQILSTIKVEKLDSRLNAIETYSLNNTDSLTVNLNINPVEGESFVVHVYDTHGISAGYTLWRNEPRGIVLEGGLACNVYCFDPS